MTMTITGSRKKNSRKRNPIFPCSAGGTLRVCGSLLETLAVDRRVLSRTNKGNKDLATFIEGAEDAWRRVYKKIESGDMNIILWIRQLLAECRGSCIWIPKVLIRRLRQLERGEIVIAANDDQPFTVPLHAGLPKEFRELCEFMDWRFPIVPSLDEEVFEDLNTRESETVFVYVVCEVWENRPDELRGKQLAGWIKAEVKREGWTPG